MADIADCDIDEISPETGKKLVKSAKKMDDRILSSENWTRQDLPSKCQNYSLCKFDQLLNLEKKNR